MKRAVVALAVLLTLAGCKTQATTTPDQSAPTTTAAAGPAAIEWADRMCAAILEFDSSAPKFEMDSSSQSAMITWLTNYLDATSARIVTATEKLQGLGAAPVAGGDEAAMGIVSSLQTMGAIVDQAKSRLTALDINDPTAARAALTDIATALQGLRTPVNPLEGMSARYPDLQAAARSADNCTEVTRVRASRSAFPPTPSSSDDYATDTSTPSGTLSGTPSGTPTSTPTETTTYPTL